MISSKSLQVDLQHVFDAMRDTYRGITSLFLKGLAASKRITKTYKAWESGSRYRGRAAVQVVDGLDIVKQIENTATGRGDVPKEAVTIADAGEL